LRSPQPVKRTITEKLNYSRAVLYSIDSSFYSADDSITFFPDGKPAYTYFLGGAAFIDSSGRPIHDRYEKFTLSDKQNQILKDSFLYELCSNIGHRCMTTFRDVLILYDSSDRVVEQAKICFHCGDAAIYPRREFMCQEESNLNYDALKKFISVIKH